MRIKSLLPDETELTNAGLKRGRRRLLLATFNHQCFFCSASLDLGNVTVDHLVPKARGGDFMFRNLVPACKPCNKAKSAKPPTDDQCRRARIAWDAAAVPEQIVALLFPVFEHSFFWKQQPKKLAATYRALVKIF